MASPPAVSVVIPFYNEEASLEPLAAELLPVMEAHGEPFEVLLVDDGSSDGSRAAALRVMGSQPDRVRLVRLPTNRGQSAALAAGIRRARGGLIVTLDADLQNDPRDIPRLLDRIAEGDCDVVSGVRTERRDRWIRRVSSRVANRVRAAALGDGISDVGCSLKVYRAELLRDVPVFNGMHRFLPALVQLAGARTTEIAVNHRPRRHGESAYGVGNRLWRGIADLLAVRWLQRRWVDLRDAREERGAPPDRRSDDGDRESS